MNFQNLDPASVSDPDEKYAIELQLQEIQQAETQNPYIALGLDPSNFFIDPTSHSPNEDFGDSDDDSDSDSDDDDEGDRQLMFNNMNAVTNIMDLTQFLHLAGALITQQQFNGDANSYASLQDLCDRLGEVKKRGAEDIIIDRLTTEVYHAPDSTCNAEEMKTHQITCHICLNDYQAEDELRVMPCKHKYHKDCLDQWLKLNSVCPICKYNIQDESNEVEHLSETDDSEYMSREEFESFVNDNIEAGIVTAIPVEKAVHYKSYIDTHLLPASIDGIDTMVLLFEIDNKCNNPRSRENNIIHTLSAFKKYAHKLQLIEQKHMSKRTYNVLTPLIKSRLY